MFGGLWAGPFDNADACRQSSALDALNASLLFDVPGTGYQAEDAALHDLSTEAKYAGFEGTSYVAGWNRDGQAVTFTVEIDAAGEYDVALRYAAAAGDAVRCVRLNGAILAERFVFPGTGSWRTWATSALYDVPLRAGPNAISVAFEKSKASRNWLNLDALTVR